MLQVRTPKLACNDNPDLKGWGLLEEFTDFPKGHQARATGVLDERKQRALKPRLGFFEEVTQALQHPTALFVEEHSIFGGEPSQHRLSSKPTLAKERHLVYPSRLPSLKLWCAETMGEVSEGIGTSTKLRVDMSQGGWSMMRTKGPHA